MKTILSTKKLKPNQRELLLNAGVSFVEYDAIQIKSLAFEIPKNAKNIIVTSQNAGRRLIDKMSELPFPLAEGREMKCFCVGQNTAALLKTNALTIKEIEVHGAALAELIIEKYDDQPFYYFCGKQRRDELPDLLRKANIACHEIAVYETHLVGKKFEQAFDALLFFSPSGVNAFAKANPSLELSQRVVCIGGTTATEARKYFKKVVVSNATTIESTIAKGINYLKENSN